MTEMNNIWNKNLAESPQSDLDPFLILLKENDVADFVIVQVSRFEGRMYSDLLDGAIDWDDAIPDDQIVAWMPAHVRGLEPYEYLRTQD